jgi:hypothetical protein
VPGAEDAPGDEGPADRWERDPTLRDPPSDDASTSGPYARDPRALIFWLVAVCVALPLSLFFGQVELGLLTAVGGMFAVAHAAERDRRWTALHVFLGGIPPGGAAAMFIAMAVWFANAQIFLDTPLPRSDRIAGAVLSTLAAAGSLALLVRPVATAAARRAFRVAEPGSVDRLGARLVVISFLVAPPGWFFIQALMATSQLDQIAIGPGSFAGSLVGFTMLTLGAVGFPVRRGWRATAERLGLRRIAWPEIALIAGGLLALVLLNAGMEWVARTWQPGMYRRDQAMNELIAGRLTGVGTLMLGISAGVGEELAMRGALLPRLGLVATSLLFAALHVQYSPLGMLTIGLIGVLLGVIRRRGGTTSAIAVHVLYDIMAAFGAQH